MGINQGERQRQHKIDKPKYSSKHPIAAIEKRVIDSAAFADLSFSARAVLLLLARNLEKDKNGHIQLSEKQAAANGIERKTLHRALDDLTAHQLIVMTWRGGRVQGACNKYALTWLRVKAHDGIHADHFKLDSWRDWIPTQNKTASPKCPPDRGQKGTLERFDSPKMSPTPGDKKGPIEVITIPHTESALDSAAWTQDYLARLAARGLAGRQCFVIPAAGPSAAGNGVGRANSCNAYVGLGTAEKVAPRACIAAESDELQEPTCYTRIADDFAPSEFWDANLGEFRSMAQPRQRATLLADCHA